MISFVVPAYNENDAVKETVLDISKALEGIDHEIIVVDDGSTDQTAKYAQDAGAIVIKHPHNLGYGAALKTGIRAARFDTIAITDADGTYPNNMILELMAKYENGFNMVVGARTGEHYNESLIKLCLRFILKWLVEYTAGREIPDINSGFRIFSRTEILPYYNHLCNTFSFTTSMTLAYMMTHKFVTYVPIPYSKRKGKTKVRLFRDSLGTLQYIIQSILYYNPLKLFLLMSSIIFISSMVCIIVGTLLSILSPFYIGIGGILVSVIVFCLGLLAELLKQILSKDIQQ